MRVRAKTRQPHIHPSLFFAIFISDLIMKEQEASDTASVATINNKYSITNFIHIHFFKNARFCSKLKKYLLNAHKVTCEIEKDGDERYENVALHLTLHSDIKQNVSKATSFLKMAFTTIQTKTYDNNKKYDKSMILFCLSRLWLI